MDSSSRNGVKVIWIAIHSAEGARDVDDLQAFFEREGNSSHAGADDEKLEEGWVPYTLAAWTLRGGNEESDNLELCGFADWTRAEWLSHMGMLRHAATWIARRCKARGIPLRKLTPADVRARKAGVIGHVDYTLGTGDGSHTDPGPNFPWDVVMDMARGGEDDVSAKDVWGYRNPDFPVGDAYAYLTRSYAVEVENQRRITDLAKDVETLTKLVQQLLKK